MTHTYNLLEEYIKKMYTSIGIYHPHQLDMEIITSRLGMSLVYYDKRSVQAEGVMFIDERISKVEQWQEFCHELCHALYQVGNQHIMPPPFRLYQEWKADSFMLHACVPTFMLDRFDIPSNESKAIYLIQKTFNVEYDFAKKRLELYLRNRRSIS